MSVQDDYEDLHDMLESSRCPLDDMYKEAFERIWLAFCKLEELELAKGQVCNKEGPCVYRKEGYCGDRVTNRGNSDSLCWEVDHKEY
jgi:hypothetical protein